MLEKGTTVYIWAVDDDVQIKKIKGKIYSANEENNTYRIDMLSYCNDVITFPVEGTKFIWGLDFHFGGTLDSNDWDLEFRNGVVIGPDSW